ncbi:uncharacterized protein G2W53_025999 [Senna tora]|uniref:Uncharacterized protein n=1 Tax=Senna tora TaxID=362788 RepID=A0A834TN62_9FABA|nr:uncharacterized protein G2W53_025999 [Senna tora]
MALWWHSDAQVNTIIIVSIAQPSSSSFSFTAIAQPSSSDLSHNHHHQIYRTATVSMDGGICRSKLGINLFSFIFEFFSFISTGGGGGHGSIGFSFISDRGGDGQCLGFD